MAQSTDPSPRRPWWAVVAPYAAVAVLVLIVICVWYQWRVARQKTEALQRAAARLGMVYEGSDEEWTRRCATLPRFGLPVGQDLYEDVLRRNAAQYSAYVFTHVRLRDPIGTHYSVRSYRTTVWAVHVQVTDMPYWCIYPRGSDTSGLYDAMAGQIVESPPSAFQKAYVLWSAKPDLTATAISEKARAILAQHSGWAVEGKGGMILFHHPTCETTPDDYDEPLRLVIDFMNCVFGTPMQEAP